LNATDKVQLFELSRRYTPHEIAEALAEICAEIARQTPTHETALIWQNSSFIWTVAESNHHKAWGLL
jgi:hypothetical protein